MTAEPDDLIERAGLRTHEEHASWREVYAALEVDTRPHRHVDRRRSETANVSAVDG